jgi:hypothetical protein
MRQLYLLQKVRSLTPIPGFLMMILLGAFITITYQPAFAAEPPQDMYDTNMKDKGEKDKDKGPCNPGDEPPINCVGVPISPIPNEYGCTTGQQCSLTTQNKTCAMGLTCKTKPIASGSTQCQCKCGN